MKATRPAERGVRISSRFAWQVVDGEAIVIDLRTGTARGLNPSGTFIWSRVETEAPESIASELSRRFAVDEAAAAEDVRAFLEALAREGYLEEAG